MTTRTDVTAIYGPVAGDLPRVDQMLTSLQHVEFPWLRSMLEATLTGGGKRLRPAIALLALWALATPLLMVGLRQHPIVPLLGLSAPAAAALSGVQDRVEIARPGCIDVHLGSPLVLQQVQMFLSFLSLQHLPLMPLWKRLTQG